MALQQMSYLVLPIARNLIAAQTLLDDVKLIAPTGNPTDDAAIAQIKSAAAADRSPIRARRSTSSTASSRPSRWATSSTSATEYLGSINGNESDHAIVKQTPNPWQDPNTPGISQNPYAFDLSHDSGLGRRLQSAQSIMDGMTWLQTQTGQSEDVAGKMITAALAGCGK